MEFSWHVDTVIYRCFGLNLTQTWFKRQTWLIGFQVSNGGDSWNFSTKHFTQRDSRVTPLGHDSEDSHSVDCTRLRHLVNSTDKWTLRWKENIATKIVNYTKTTVETSCKLTWEIRNSNIFQWFLDGVLKQRHEVLFRHLDAFEKGRPPRACCGTFHKWLHWLPGSKSSSVAGKSPNEMGIILWLCQIAIENGHRNSGFTVIYPLKMGGFSI